MKGKKLKYMQNNVVLLYIINQCLFINLNPKCANCHVLCFIFYSFCYFIFLLLGQASIALGGQKVSGISAKVSRN